MEVRTFRRNYRLRVLSIKSKLCFENFQPMFYFITGFFIYLILDSSKIPSLPTKLIDFQLCFLFFVEERVDEVDFLNFRSNISLHVKNYSKLKVFRRVFY